MYALVLFTDEGAHEIVPDNWIDGHLQKDAACEVAFPSRNEAHKIRAMIKTKISPKSTWCSYTATILYVNGKRPILLF